MLLLQTIHTVVHPTAMLASVYRTSSIVLVQPANMNMDSPADAPFALCDDPFVVIVRFGLTSIISVLRALGVAIAVHGIVMGGLTRILSFGNQRRISKSNLEIASAIVGLIIVILSVALGNSIPVWFGLADHSCPVIPMKSL